MVVFMVCCRTWWVVAFLFNLKTKHSFLSSISLFFKFKNSQLWCSKKHNSLYSSPTFQPLPKPPTTMCSKIILKHNNSSSPNVLLRKSNATAKRDLDGKLSFHFLSLLPFCFRFFKTYKENDSFLSNNLFFLLFFRLQKITRRPLVLTYLLPAPKQRLTTEVQF